MKTSKIKKTTGTGFKIIYRLKRRPDRKTIKDMKKYFKKKIN